MADKEQLKPDDFPVHAEQNKIVKPDGTIIPGTHANVKVHLRWRSAAWWVSQKLASVVEWGLW